MRVAWGRHAVGGMMSRPRLGVWGDGLEPSRVQVIEVVDRLRCVVEVVYDVCFAQIIK